MRPISNLNTAQVVAWRQNRCNFLNRSFPEVSKVCTGLFHSSTLGRRRSRPLRPCTIQFIWRGTLRERNPLLKPNTLSGSFRMVYAQSF